LDVAKDFIVDVPNGAKNDGVYAMKEYVTICSISNDG
jgi:hypothetical protein